MKNLMRKAGRIGLVWQITIAFSLIMIIPASIVAGTYQAAFKNSLMEEADNSMNEKLDEITRNMETHIQETNSMLDQLEFTQEFYYYLDDENPLSEKEINYYMFQAQAELTNINNAYPNLFQHISIFSSNPDTCFGSGWAYSIQDIVYREYFSEIFDSTEEQIYGYVRYQQYDESNPQLNHMADRNALIFPTYRKIFSLNNGKCIGVIEADINLGKLVEGTVPTPQSAAQKVFIFNHNNQLMYSSDPSLTDDFSIIDIQDEAGIITVEASGKEYLFAYRRNPQTRLLQTVAMDKGALLESSSLMQWILWLGAGASVLLLAFLTNIVARVMLKSLREMDCMIEKIEQGDFNVSVKQTGFNEISRIAKSFNRMASRLQSVLEHMMEKENAQKEAELRALQAQINPHFLYNTLENMRMQCEIDEYYIVGNSLASLGEMLRYSMRWEAHQVPLETELKHLKNYLSLLKMRFDTQFDCKINIASGLEKTMIPKMILQPVVENCFSHGFKNKPAPWYITITGALMEDRMMLVITDNGNGITERRLRVIRDALENPGHSLISKNEKTSIGLLNVRQRIILTCPTGSSLTINSTLGQGTSVVIEIFKADEEDV